MRRDQHIDEIELQHPNRVQRAAEVTHIVGSRGPAAVETLCGKRNTARFRGRDSGPT